MGIFVVTWVVALAIWHFGQIERKWELQAAEARAEAAEINASRRPSWN